MTPRVRLARATTITAVSCASVLGGLLAVPTLAGAATTVGSPGADRLIGTPGADRINGKAGFDRINGGAGDDILTDRSGKTAIRGRSGDDRINVRDDAGDDAVSCGSGDDLVIADPGDRVLPNCEREAPKRIDTGGNPSAIRITADGSTAWVYTGEVNQPAGALASIDTSTGAVTSRFTAGTNDVLDLALNRAGETAFLANFGVTGEPSGVSVVDLTNERVLRTVPVQPRPSAITVVPRLGGEYVYVAGSPERKPGTTTFFRTDATQTEGAILGTPNQPFGLGASADGSRIVIGSGGDGTAGIIDTATNALTTVSSGDAFDNPSQGVAVNGDGTRAYVSGAAGTTVLDVARNRFTSLIQTQPPFNTGGAALSPDGKTLAVMNADDFPPSAKGTISIIDTATNRITATIQASFLQVNPRGMAFSRDGRDLYVGSLDGGVWVYPSTMWTRTG